MIMAIQSMNSLSVLEGSPHLKYLIAALSGLLVFVFGKRLLQLKPEHFEYGYLFTWPPKNNFSSQLKAAEFLTGLGQSINASFGSKRNPQVILKYPQDKNIFVRAFHWDHAEPTDIKIIGLLIILLMPALLLYVKNQPEINGFFRNVYSNFLLLTLTPVLMTIGEHYKKIAFWGYDLLKPVTKVEYLKEQGIVILNKLLTYWFLLCICLAVFPSIIFQPDIFAEKRFWAYLALTADFSLLVLSWLALLACVLNSTVVIINGIILSSIALFYFYLVPRFSFEQLILNNLICFICAVALLFKAYQAWGEKEFDQKM